MITYITDDWEKNENNLLYWWFVVFAQIINHENYGELKHPPIKYNFSHKPNKPKT